MSTTPNQQAQPGQGASSAPNQNPAQDAAAKGDDQAVSVSGDDLVSAEMNAGNGGVDAEQGATENREADPKNLH
ncbi:hypothetical protein LJY25_10420 [Hymenobacter sp. BT175]|uniref:hypothetical protein n=1 Tax=Hymenobacter translucens TaxID=2886507 RepID=UPI001D0DDCA5|nr:hypothetical protein [Hymenobacter translucens]MCC2546859.1 hypothetical protein [Hymenobacter translucens]